MCALCDLRSRQIEARQVFKARVRATSDAADPVRNDVPSEAVSVEVAMDVEHVGPNPHVRLGREAARLRDDGAT